MLGGQPHSVVDLLGALLRISPDGHSAYVADRDSGTVAVIHTG
jgi:DNA-binding beta-propeller fold protein YncE